jgi:hypothetical protein
MELNTTSTSNTAEDGASYSIDLADPEAWHPYMERFQLYGSLPPVPWVQRLLENEMTQTKESSLVSLALDIDEAECELTLVLSEAEALLANLKNTESDAAMILGAVVITVSPSPPDISGVAQGHLDSVKCPTRKKEVTFYSKSRNEKKVSLPLSYNEHESMSRILLASLEGKRRLELERVLAILLTNPAYLVNIHRRICLAPMPHRLRTKTWNTRINALRLSDAIIEMFESGTDNGFREHRMLVLMDDILGTELPYLRRFSQNSFHVFACSYSFIDSGRSDDDGGGTTVHPETEHPMIFGRLLRHYLSNQCSNIIPLLSPLARDILRKSENNAFDIRWRDDCHDADDTGSIGGALHYKDSGSSSDDEDEINEQGTKKNVRRKRTGRKKPRTEEEEAESVDAVMNLHSQVFLSLGDHLSSNVKWLFGRIHRRIAHEFDRDVCSNPSVVRSANAQEEERSGRDNNNDAFRTKFSSTGRQNDDDVCILIGRLLVETIIIPMLDRPFQYKLWTDEMRYKKGVHHFTIAMFRRGAQHLKRLGRMLKVVIANRHDAPYSSMRWQNLPTNHMRKGREMVENTRLAVRKIIHEKNAHRKFSFPSLSIIVHHCPSFVY